MLRLLKKLGWVALLVAAAQSASAFSLWGIREPYQIDALGYIGDFSFQPHNLGEEFRWNIPTLYYTYDQSFLDYFGSNGVETVDAAVKIINGAFSTNVSSWSDSLNEFCLEASQMNYTASAMHLYDLKSCTLEILVERLGLVDPEAYTWTLRNRVQLSGTPGCPFNMLYSVIKRNFDPVSWAPSVYVNGNLYTYSIIENCPASSSAITIPTLVDSDGLYSTPIASPKISTANTLYYGFYHTALTRDDIGGLRYLYRTNNVNLENAGPGTLTRLTNNVSQLLVTSNLAVFASQALNTNAAALQGLYPDLVITGTTNTYAVVWTTNLTPYFTNYPFDPVGTPPHIAFITNRTAGVQTYYHHSFANLSTVVFRDNAWWAQPIYDLSAYSNRTFVTVRTTYTTNAPWTPATSGIVVTNTSTRTFLTNMIAGEYFILPTNSCDVAILSPILTMTNVFTNTLASLTNITTITDTNGAGTNISFFSQDLLTYSTNHVFVVYPINCAGTNVAWRQGIDKIQLVRRDFDSLLGRYWYPVTNRYTVMTVTNNTLYPQIIDRVVAVPDITFSAADLVTGPTANPLINPVVSRQVPNVGTNGIVPGLYGPGTIEPTVSFTFNKVGPLYYNYGPFLMDEQSATLDYIWATFDGSTNPPVVYPIGTSIANLESQILMQVTASNVLSGTDLGAASTLYGVANSSFKVQFTAMGAQPPYIWSLAPQSGNLPAGFVQPTDAERTLPDGIIEGTPLAPGTYDFVLRLTEGNGQRFVDRPYTIVINP